MTIRQKIIAGILSLIFIFMTIFLLNNYESFDDISLSSSTEYEINTIPTTVEKYKIMNVVYEKNNIYAILHLDNGNVKILKITEAYIDPNLKNINEGYLYRDGLQIYIRKE